MSNGVKLEPVALNFTLKDHSSDVLREPIVKMNLYDEATDLGCDTKGEGIRVLSFRHELNAGHAATAGFLTERPGICVTYSAPDFPNGLTALAHAAINRWPMILISDSSEREIVGPRQGDDKGMDQLAIARPYAGVRRRRRLC